MDYPTLDGAKRALRKMEKKDVGPLPPAMNGEINRITNGVGREYNAVLMQGPSQSSRSSLFLIADGAGSAAAYIQLLNSAKISRSPRPSSQVAMGPGPEKFYLAAIRAKQPKKPYLLGGWSAGGVFAYEVARRLLNDANKSLD